MEDNESSDNLSNFCWRNFLSGSGNFGLYRPNVRSENKRSTHSVNVLKELGVISVDILLHYYGPNGT